MRVVEAGRERAGPGAPPLRVVFVVSAPSEAIKLAPVVHALDAHPELQSLVLATGSQRGQLDEVLGVFGLVADADLEVVEPHQELAAVAGRIGARLRAVFARLRPDVVVVLGATTAAAAAALVAFYEHLPVVHVEAGLRSRERNRPFPEEANRRLIDAMAALDLAPTPRARANLLSDGVADQSIVVTGSTAIDALLWATRAPGSCAEPALAAIEADDRPLVLVTAHRRESWGRPLDRVGAALAEVARVAPGAHIVVSTDANPVVGATLHERLSGLDNVVVTEPLDYLSFARLLKRSRFLVTDGGGVQEGAPSLNKPVLVLREVTERPEGVEAGVARLVGTQTAAVRDAVLELLEGGASYAAMVRGANPYGDGRAAHRSAAAIAHLLGLGPAPEPFAPAMPIAIDRRSGADRRAGGPPRTLEHGPDR